MSSEAPAGVVVFGSINLDLVTRVARFPRPGETLGGGRFTTHPGGKGANQALAAARAGASVSLVGCIGRDAFGEAALALLRGHGVDLAHVRRVDGATGTATILVDASGENAIVVAPGANGCVEVSDLSDDLLGPSRLLLLQGELPTGATVAAAVRARALGARVVLNLAPPFPLGAEALAATSVIVVNEHEAAALGGMIGLPTDPASFVRALAARSPAVPVVTLGAAGALAASGGRAVVVPPPRVKVVDTTAAGDAFVGALAAKLAAGVDVLAALPFAVAAGSLACTRNGAQPSLPEAAEIEALAATLAPRS